MTFVQDSWSRSTVAGTIRGFHFQVPPRAQHKLVRVIRGKVYDVIVDIRHGSDTFGQHIAIELDLASRGGDWRSYNGKGEENGGNFGHGLAQLRPLSPDLDGSAAELAPRDGDCNGR